MKSWTIPNTHVESQVYLPCVYNPNTEGEDGRIPSAYRSASQASPDERQSSDRRYLKQTNNEVEKTLNADLTLFSTDMCTSKKHTYTYIHAQRSFSQKQRDGGALLIYIKISVFASFIA